jgi:DNA primase
MALEELVKLIKEAPISTIIGNYLPLVRKGTSILCKCPFHNDSNPSLNINDKKGLFMCFACQTGGDSISFVQKYKTLDFKEALREMAQILNLDFESFDQKRSVDPKREMAYKIMTRATALFRRQAQQQGKEIFQQFLKTRGLKEEVAEQFQLGLALKEGVAAYLNSLRDPDVKRNAVEVAKTIGIIKPDKHGGSGHYDTFRHRIVFPIWDQYGQVIAFTSRSLTAENMPKYLNSPESFIFSKKHTLYGLHLAKNSIRSQGEVLLVEGNMDVISLHQNGFTNAVGIMGTSFNETTLTMVKSLAKTVYLCLDNDTAGQEATRKAAELMIQNQIKTLFVDLSPAKDPDDFMLQLGPIEFKERINRARNILDVLIERIIPTEIPESLDRRLEVLNKIFEILAPLGESLEVSERIANLIPTLHLRSTTEQIFQVYLDFLKSRNDRITKSPREVTSVESNSDKLSSIIMLENKALAETPVSIDEKKLLLEPMTNGEKLLIQECLRHPSILDHGKMIEILDLIGNSEVKRVVEDFLRLTSEIELSEFTKTAGTIISEGNYSKEIKNCVALVLFQTEKQVELPKGKSDQLVLDVRIAIEKDLLKRKRQELKKLQEQSANEHEVRGLLKTIHDIQIQLHDLIKNKGRQPLKGRPDVG